MYKLTHSFTKASKILGLINTILFAVCAIVFLLVGIGLMAIDVPANTHEEIMGAEIAVGAGFAVMLFTSMLFFVLAIYFLIGTIISKNALRKLETAKSKKELIATGILLIIFGAFPGAGIVMLVLPEQYLAIQ